MIELLGDTFGFLSAVFVGTYLIPQCWMMWKTKTVFNVSRGMVALCFLGDLFSMLHMLLVIDWNWMLASRTLLVFGTSTTLLILYYLYRKNK